jgi:putative inorganic carbon (hco3(-)) transporter
VASGTVVAMVALLQFARLDPFLLINLTNSLQGSSRMRIYATLGNPNFVAALLTGILPLTVSVWAAGGRHFPRIGPKLFMAAGLLQAGAIAATGSRAPILGFVAAGAWLVFRRAQSRIRFLLPVLAVCAVLIWFSPARPLEKTMAGRLYIWKIIGSHVSGIPLAGYGPGAFALRFAEWETAYLGDHPSAPDREFAGLQERAHNDYLEILVDCGFLGLTAFLLMIVLLLSRCGSSVASGLDAGIVASIFALLAVALVDFPLHRPAELFLFWNLLALPWISGLPGSAGMVSFFGRVREG